MLFALFTANLSSNPGKNILRTQKNTAMNTEKLSISLPLPLSNFITQYQTEHECRSKSEVIQKAIKLLQQKELEGFYRAADSEIDPGFEITSFDGLDDETW